MLHVVLHEEEDVRILCILLWDHVLFAYPNETHHAARRRRRTVLLALRNQLVFI